MLRCPLVMSPREKTAAKMYSEEIRHLGNPFLSRCEYLPAELLVYDSYGDPVRTDVIMEEEPDGDPLRAYIRSRLMVSDRKPFRELLRGFAAMSEYFYGNSIIHGNLRHGNIIVNAKGIPVALNYPMSYDKRPRADIKGFASLVLNTYIAACEPSLYAGFHVPDMLMPEVMDRNVRHIITQGEFLRNEALTGIAGIYMKDGADRVMLNRYLTSLAETPFTPLPLLAGLAAEYDGNVNIAGAGNYDPEGKAFYREDDTFKLDFRKCDFVAPVADTLIRFRIEGKWDFADRYGNRITDCGFSDALDFYEGCAVVATERGHGMINRSGRFVLGPGFEAIEWYGKENVASACADGKWELYDRTGRQLTSGAYDWMSDCSEGIFLVRRGNKFGYLHADGTKLTAMRFDDAYSFRNGTATVRTGSEVFKINREGRRGV